MNAREKIRAFLKGRALPEGTTRRHGGIWKRKQADGSWKPVPGEKRQRSAETEKPRHTHGHGALVREKYADGRLKPVEGDSVFMQASGMFGTPGGITGAVTRNRAGELRVSVTRVSSFLGGDEKLPAKTYPLDARWTVKDDPEIERRKHEENQKTRAEKTALEDRHKNASRDADEKYAQALAQGARKPDLEKLKEGDIVTKFYPDYSSGKVDIQYYRIGHPPEGDHSGVSPEDIEYQRKIRAEDKKRNRAEGNIIGYRVDARGEPLYEDSTATLFAKVGSEEEDRLVAGAFKFEGKKQDESSETIEISPGKDAKTINAINNNAAQTALEIDPGLIYASEQIRKKFDPAALEELAGSIQSHGLLQPLVVRPDGKGRFEIIAGERRFRAIQSLIKQGEWEGGVTVSVQDVDDRTKDLMQLAENFDRQDNTAGEVADFFKRLMDRHGMTVAEIAAKRGMSAQTVRAHLAITELHPDLRRELDRGNLPKTAAQLLGSLNHGQQLRAYSEMLRKNMNTGTFRNYVQALKTQGSFFSEDEIKTDEMKAAGRALGEKSPEKLQQKFQQTLDKHQQFLNKFFDADGSRLSALALAATGDFDRTMERMQLMQNEVERVMREMRTHRDKVKGDEAQEAMFKSALAEFAGLGQDLARVRVLFLVLDFLKAKGANLGEIHHWAKGDFKKEDHGWSKVKQDIRQHLDRLHKKAHLRDAVVTRNLDELNARHRTYAEVADMSDAGIVDRFNVAPEKVAGVRQQAAERLKKTETALKRHSRIAEGPGLNSYRPKRDPYDRVREYAAQVEQFLTESYGRHLDRKSEERLAPLRAKLADRAGELGKLQTALAKLDPEKDEDAAGEIDEQIQDIESEIEQLEDRISRTSERTASQKADHAGSVSGRIGDLADKSRDVTEADMAGVLEQQQAVLGRGQHNPEAPRGPERSRLMLTRKKILGRLARPKLKSVAARLMAGRATVGFFLKGRGFPEGTIRRHGGIMKRKQADGSWKPESTGGARGTGTGAKRKKNPKNKEEDSPGGKVDRYSSEEYRFRDTGYIPGARKEDAAKVIRRYAREGHQMSVESLDWQDLEKNPREAQTLIKKSFLFGRVDWDGLRAQGLEPGAGFLIDRVYAQVPAEPAADTPESRYHYTLALQTLRARIEKAKTPQEVTDTLEEILNEYAGVLYTETEKAELGELSKAKRAAIEGYKAYQENISDLYRASLTSNSRKYAAENLVEQRQKRGWQVRPEDQAELEAARENHRQRQQAWKDALVHPEYRPDLDRKENSPYETKRAALDKRIQTIQALARERHRGTEVFKTWAALGDRFTAAVNFRGVSGSKTFAGHVTRAKAGLIKDWSWQEKARMDRGPGKQAVAFQLKVAEEFSRDGGRAVKLESTAALKETFALRDIQSGNWVLKDVASAAFHVQKTGEAFSDLADILGVADRAVSLDGQLAIAFGARGAGGKGAARAKYEPVHRIINLTKMGGGGVLGQEWFQALDNLILSMEKGAGGSGENWGDHATENSSRITNPALRAAFENLTRALTEGDIEETVVHSYSAAEYRKAKYNFDVPRSFLARAIKQAGNLEDALKAVRTQFSILGQVRSKADEQALDRPVKRNLKNAREWFQLAVAYHGGSPDGGEVLAKTGRRVSAYYQEALNLEPSRTPARTNQLAARAFAAYCEDKLKAQKRRNDYLSSFADNRYYALEGKKPYPEGTERTRINRAFDEVFERIRAGSFMKKISDYLKSLNTGVTA